MTELMTGFALTTDAPLTQVISEIKNRTEEIRTDIQASAKEIKSHQSQVAAAQAADIAGQLRALMLAVSREMPDCPRLFTLVPQAAGGWSRLKAWQNSYQLTLWCEHPGEEHPWPAARYKFSRPKEWLATIAPYLFVLSTILRAAVPIAGAALGAVTSEQEYKDMKRDLDLMKALVEKLPKGQLELSSSFEPQETSHGVEGAELRSLRALLLHLDPAMAFGGLRRVVTSSGDYLWICPTPEHYKIYDPGLPVLPQATGRRLGWRCG